MFQVVHRACTKRTNCSCSALRWNNSCPQYCPLGLRFSQDCITSTGIGTIRFSTRRPISQQHILPHFVILDGLARFGEQHDIPGVLGSSPSPSGHLLRRDDTRLGSQGESSQGATGPDVFQPGTKGGMLLGRERRGVSSSEVTGELQLVIVSAEVARLTFVVFITLFLCRSQILLLVANQLRNNNMDVWLQGVVFLNYNESGFKQRACPSLTNPISAG